MRWPALTLRARLTLLFALIFAVGGLIVVAISYALVANSPTFTTASGSGSGLDPKATAFQQQCALAKQAGQFDSPLMTKCEVVLSEAVKVGAKAQRDTTLAKLPVYALITICAVTALATLAGWVLAGRVLRPLAKITEAARAASQTNLSQRLTLGGPRDELRLLADTFDDMLARLDASFESQRSFIANASHELRTPLSVVRTSVDVVLAKPAPSAGELGAMGDDVREAVDRAEAVLEALLTLARNERGLTAAEPNDLATLGSGRRQFDGRRNAGRAHQPRTRPGTRRHRADRAADRQPGRQRRPLQPARGRGPDQHVGQGWADPADGDQLRALDFPPTPSTRSSSRSTGSTLASRGTASVSGWPWSHPSSAPTTAGSPLSAAPPADSTSSSPCRQLSQRAGCQAAGSRRRSTRTAAPVATMIVANWTADSLPVRVCARGRRSR